MFDFTELEALDSSAMSDNAGGNIAYSGDPISATTGPEQLTEENKDPEQTPIINTGTGPGPTFTGNEAGARPENIWC